MLKLILMFCLILTTKTFAKNNVKEKSFYGKEVKASSAVVLDEVIKNFSHYEDKKIVMEAQVEKVCVHKGCWMTLQGSDETLRVMFDDYSYFVPLSLQGKKVWVEGKVSRKELSVKEKRHYLEDAGASKSEISAIKKPSFEYSIVALGVKVLK
ncbi:MAG: DUF4920 domain-containing protein [Halobacteriovoraceae bacterium]|nr:DUF4920 domain-containing protein [Halobacteriovoraceae bacterium]|tara:strand:+ start:11626 stop:12084 length:459 start_codon:yes stop_codon:yes gene_type:complete